MVADRARGCCESCRSQAAFATESFCDEHINPESLGGATAPENLALSRSGCNGHKSVKTEGAAPQTGSAVPLYDPRRQRWHEHFAWNNDFTQFVGLTPTGRATVTELQLNRPGLANLRGAVRALGAHPPPDPEGLG